MKLHIIAQPGPVRLETISYSHWLSQGNIDDTCYENLLCILSKVVFTQTLSALRFSLCLLAILWISWVDIYLAKTFLITCFSTSTRVCSVSYIASMTLLKFLVFIHPSFALSHPVPRLPSVGYDLPHDVTVSLGRQILHTGRLVIRWRRPRPGVFRFTYTVTS